MRLTFNLLLTEVVQYLATFFWKMMWYLPIFSTVLWCSEPPVSPYMNKCFFFSHSACSQ